MRDVPAELAAHPDRLKWNAKYRDGAGGSFLPHPLAERALDLALPDGPVLELACGPSGAALLAARSGRRVTAVDISEIALDRLGREARERGVAELITLVQADLEVWRPDPAAYSLVLCTLYWDRTMFDAATAAVAPGGALGWEAFTLDARRFRPEWRLSPGEPAALLPSGFTVLDQRDVDGGRRRLLAVRGAGLSTGGEPG
ncbi:class I SAM-dependent methyltransferase [Spirillospora sp. CA-294931]|uniref:class I SAM-dependent methyltransferase n=1 Tax=Spirillospora sp. CA-294931 TaxID=3240042 RepID=UPI003D943DC7